MGVYRAKTKGALEVGFGHPGPWAKLMQYADGIVDRVVVESEFVGVDGVVDAGPGRS